MGILQVGHSGGDSAMPARIAVCLCARVCAVAWQFCFKRRRKRHDGEYNMQKNIPFLPLFSLSLLPLDRAKQAVWKEGRQRSKRNVVDIVDLYVVRTQVNLQSITIVPPPLVQLSEARNDSAFKRRKMWIPKEERKN